MEINNFFNESPGHNPIKDIGEKSRPAIPLSGT
jgi:hypothetical protein